MKFDFTRLMQSDKWLDRFKAFYWQVKLERNKLYKKLNDLENSHWCSKEREIAGIKLLKKLFVTSELYLEAMDEWIAFTDTHPLGSRYVREYIDDISDMLYDNYAEPEKKLILDDEVSDCIFDVLEDKIWAEIYSS